MKTCFPSQIKSVILIAYSTLKNRSNYYRNYRKGLNNLQLKLLLRSQTKKLK